MTTAVINISDIELQPRPVALSPTGPAAERFEPLLPSAEASHV